MNKDTVMLNKFKQGFSYGDMLDSFKSFFVSIWERYTMKTYTYVDNSNFFIEGQRLAAVKNGKAKDIWDAMNNRILDLDWQPDYGKLHDIVCKQGKEVGFAKLWGSPPPYDTFWKKIEEKGFEVKTYERPHGKEKKVDTAIAVQMIEDSFSIDSGEGIICLVAGDSDYVPALESLKKRGYKVLVLFWGQASQELKDAASTFINLDDYFNLLKSENSA